MAFHADHRNTACTRHYMTVAHGHHLCRIHFERTESDRAEGECHHFTEMSSIHIFGKAGIFFSLAIQNYKKAIKTPKWQRRHGVATLIINQSLSHFLQWKKYFCYVLLQRRSFKKGSMTIEKNSFIQIKFTQRE